MEMTVNVGARIRQIRESKGISASDLARLASVTPTAVWNWETNGTTPRSQALSAVCRALNVTEEYLLFGRGISAEGKTATSGNQIDTILDSTANQIADLLAIARGRVKVRFEVMRD